jgi:3-hydroxybutyryl-CoA dehydrogenase
MENRRITQVAVVGSGFMGAQIALQCAVHGCQVRCVDRQQTALSSTSDQHRKELERRVTEAKLSAVERDSILARISYTTDLPVAVANVDLVIENAPERLELKRELFAELDRLCPQGAILASNTSSFVISAIESATKRPEKLLNMHFFPPVWQRRIVELMGGTSTSKETLAEAEAFGRSIGLTPLIVQKESTGLIFNRVWRSIKRECLHLVDEGVASHGDVDRAWMVMTGMPIGPFGLMDMVGLDVVRDIELVYHAKSGNDADVPPALLLNKIAAGELGVKTGKGFYTYPGPEFQKPDWLNAKK